MDDVQGLDELDIAPGDARPDVAEVCEPKLFTTPSTDEIGMVHPDRTADNIEAMTVELLPGEGQCCVRDATFEDNFVTQIG